MEISIILEWMFPNILCSFQVLGTTGAPTPWGAGGVWSMVWPRKRISCSGRIPTLEISCFIGLCYWMRCFCNFWIIQQSRSSLGLSGMGTGILSYHPHQSSLVSYYFPFLDIPMLFWVIIPSQKPSHRRQCAWSLCRALDASPKWSWGPPPVGVQIAYGRWDSYAPPPGYPVGDCILRKIRISKLQRKVLNININVGWLFCFLHWYGSFTFGECGLWWQEKAPQTFRKMKSKADCPWPVKCKKVNQKQCNILHWFWFWSCVHFASKKYCFPRTGKKSGMIFSPQTGEMPPSTQPCRIFRSSLMKRLPNVHQPRWTETETLRRFS